jgi:hypothetical protein|tara:strand:+ start:473 stop:607 length:135 start_codon:yes stop_codon:yes gene_type:complete
MGCGCNKKIKKEKPVSKTKEVLRKMWQKSQTTVKPLNVKQINKP